MTAFLIIGVIGVGVLAISLVFGEALDGLLDLDFLGGDLFSLASIAAFLGAFGFGGLLSLSLVDVVWIATLVGAVIGALAAWGATSLTRWLKRGESGSQFRTNDLVGATGRVVTAIPADGLGEVIVRGPNGSLKRSARAATAIPAGTEVWISGIVSPTAVEVTAAHPLPQP